MGRVSAFLTPEDRKARDSIADKGRIYMAEVMDARSPSKSGEILVWVLNSGTDRENINNWILAKPCVSNYGLTLNDSTVNSSKFNDVVTSYGSWNPVPYVGNYVFIFYPNTQGGGASAYYFGSPMKSENMMLPGISYNLKAKSNQTDFTPTCEYNTRAESSDIHPYSPLQEALKEQGLDKDRLRGISTASSYRDTPSHCYGFLSPLGNQFVIDDGWATGDKNISWVNDPRKNPTDNNERDDYGKYHSKQKWIASLKSGDKSNKLNRFHGGFRFRTRNGTQLLILDSGNIYAINKDGSAWVELSEDGYIDCYSKKGISASSDADINLRAKNINIEATEKLSLKCASNLSVQTDANVMMKTASLNVSSRVSVPQIIAGNGYIGTFKSPTAEITGVFGGTLQGTAFYATYAGNFPMEQQQPNIETKIPDPVSVKPSNKVPGKVDGNKITTIASRCPTHEPWAGHDKNDKIPNLVVTQATAKVEIPEVNTSVAANIVRT